MIKIYEKGTDERKALEYVAAYLNMRAGFEWENYRYKVEDIYFDFGQDWKWTTIVAYGKHEYQILNPREHEEILTFSSTAQLDQIASELWDKRIK